MILQLFIITKILRTAKNLFLSKISKSFLLWNVHVTWRLESFGLSLNFSNCSVNNFWIFRVVPSMILNFWQMEKLASFMKTIFEVHLYKSNLVNQQFDFLQNTLLYWLTFTSLSWLMPGTNILVSEEHKLHFILNALFYWLPFNISWSTIKTQAYLVHDLFKILDFLRLFFLFFFKSV